MRIVFYTRGFLYCFAWMLPVACAAERTQQQPPDYPRKQERLCNYVGLEAVSTPQQQDADSVTLMAVYRFSEPNVPPPRDGLAVKFQVNRSRVSDLHNHLAAHPEVICTPDSDAHYNIRVTPFSADPQLPATAPTGQ